jgi:preprotein translocase subunit SecE
MAIAQKHDGKKWIQTSVAVTCMLLGYVCLSFFETLGEWFDLEAKVPNFAWLIQGLAIAIGLVTFIVIIKKENTSTFLNEVFSEAVKVVWPERSQTVRMTVGIMIGVTVMGLVFYAFDLAANFLLGLIR